MSVESSKRHSYPIYDWVDKTFVTLVLASQNSHPTILDLTIDYAAKRGENYRSALYRADVSYTVKGESTKVKNKGYRRCWLSGEAKRKSLIIKAKLYDSNGTEDSRQYVDYMFQRERLAYRHILKKCCALMANSGQPTTFAPK